MVCGMEDQTEGAGRLEQISSADFPALYRKGDDTPTDTAENHRMKCPYQSVQEMTASHHLLLGLSGLKVTE
jgi:hypothetical protein